MKTKIIGMAELAVVKPPQNVATLGLGSCVGIVLWDKTTKTGGMVHVVMPDSQKQPGAARAKFADTGADELLSQMLRAGANRRGIVAKLAGGAHMFGKLGGDSLKIGDKNAFNSKMAVLRLKIPVVAEDLGGTCGRTIELNPSTGELMIKTVGKGVKIL